MIRLNPFGMFSPKFFACFSLLVAAASVECFADQSCHVAQGQVQYESAVSVGKSVLFVNPRLRMGNTLVPFLYGVTWSPNYPGMDWDNINGTCRAMGFKSAISAELAPQTLQNGESAMAMDSKGEFSDLFTMREDSKSYFEVIQSIVCEKK